MVHVLIEPDSYLGLADKIPFSGTEARTPPSASAVPDLVRPLVEPVPLAKSRAVAIRWLFSAAREYRPRAIRNNIALHSI